MTDTTDRELLEMACRKCGGAMKPGKAMGQTMDCSDEGTCSPAGPGKLIDCMKCERCGWSVTAVRDGCALVGSGKCDCTGLCERVKDSYAAASLAKEQS